MGHLLEGVGRWLRADDGPTAVEYAVVLAMILGTLFAGAAQFGTALGARWQGIATAVSGLLAAGSEAPGPPG